MARARRAPLARILSGYIEDEAGCWVWQRFVDRHGYGHTSLNGRHMLAHRASYELLRGPIPPGLTLDHLCRNTRCINPDHLEPVTNRENILRGDGTSARNARKTHCPAGHPYAGDNLRRWRGVRICRACADKRRAVAYVKARARAKASLHSQPEPPR